MRLRFIFIFCMLVSANVWAQTKHAKKPVAKSKKVEFKVLRTDKNARKITEKDFVQLNIKGIVASSDSVLFDSYSAGKPYEIPGNEQTIGRFFLQLKMGDSAVFSVVADTLFNKSFRQPLPPGIKPGDHINFTVSILGISSEEERLKQREAMMKEREEGMKGLKVKDSADAAKYIAGLSNVLSTPSGLKYQVISAGKGKQVATGDKLTVTYKGTFLDGKVFDETRDGQPGFSFEIGKGQVIAGWDEGLLLMKEGDSYKFIIPWQLAYGERGSGPIPAYATLVFEVRIDKIN